MMAANQFPPFEECLLDIEQFIQTLVNDYEEGEIKSWGDLDQRVKYFFTPEMMDQTCSVIPHWKKMASYGDGITLTHVICVFLGMYMMPEFLEMNPDQQQMMKWVILFHDVEKEPQEGKRDHLHAFRSTVSAAKSLPDIGFPITAEYKNVFDDWCDFTWSSKTTKGIPPIEVQDNEKLPIILDGIQRMFGHNTPATLILKTILFHLSVNMNNWPPPTPLTPEEELHYIDMELLPLLRVMNLGDGEGWSMFNPETRDDLRMDTLQVFEKLNKAISSSGKEN